MCDEFALGVELNSMVEVVGILVCCCEDSSLTQSPMIPIIDLIFGKTPWICSSVNVSILQSYSGHVILPEVQSIGSLPFSTSSNWLKRLTHVLVVKFRIFTCRHNVEYRSRPLLLITKWQAVQTYQRTIDLFLYPNHTTFKQSIGDTFPTKKEVLLRANRTCFQVSDQFLGTEVFLLGTSSQRLTKTNYE